jgi:hypothetical protein
LNSFSQICQLINVQCEQPGWWCCNIQIKKQQCKEMTGDKCNGESTIIFFKKWNKEEITGGFQWIVKLIEQKLISYHTWQWFSTNWFNIIMPLIFCSTLLDRYSCCLVVVSVVFCVLWKETKIVLRCNCRHAIFVRKLIAESQSFSSKSQIIKLPASVHSKIFKKL